MEYKDFIKPGNKVIFDPILDPHKSFSFLDEPKVVQISEYRPYYTSGMPDPKPEEYEEICMVEVEGDLEDTQVYLACLLPIVKTNPKEDVTFCIYNDVVCSVIGHDENEDYYVVDFEGEEVVIEDYDFVPAHELPDLSYEDLMELYGQIGVGSIFIADYRNSFGIDPHLLSAYGDGFWEDLEEKYGKDAEAHNTAEEFADYVYGCC